LTVKDEVTAVLNRAGQIALVAVPAAGNKPSDGGGEEEAPAQFSYAVLLDDGYTITVNDDNEDVYTYTVFADGNEMELSFSAEQALTPGQIFAYTVDGEFAVPASSALSTGTVEYVATKTVVVAGREREEIDFVVIDGVEYTLDPMAQLTTILTYPGEDEFEVCEEKDFPVDTAVSFHADENRVIKTAFFSIEES